MKRINLISLYSAIGLSVVLIAVGFIFGKNGISDNGVSSSFIIFIYGIYAIPFLVGILGAILAVEKKIKQAVVSFAIGLVVLIVSVGLASFVKMLQNPTDLENFDYQLTPESPRPMIQE